MIWTWSNPAKPGMAEILNANCLVRFCHYDATQVFSKHNLVCYFQKTLCFNENTEQAKIK